MMKFTFLSENKTERDDCTAEFGLSVFIETEEMKLLFDAGASDLFARNAACRKVNLREADALVISHGHYDHTEGVPAFCRINSHAPVYLHKNAFGASYGMIGGEIDKKSCGILWDEETKQEILPRIRFTDGPIRLTDQIVISGTIPDTEGIRPTETFWRKNEQGELVRDDMSHEQFLAIRCGEQGIYLFSGCSHKGVIPALEYAKTLFPGEKIAGLIAGMHLLGADRRTRQEVVDRIAAENLDMVMPVHCTGIEAICMLKNALGDRCILAAAGNRYRI